jgi:hypothetical protein
MDYQSLLYDPIYNMLGVPATGLDQTITVIDKTTGVAIPDKTLIETVRPVANVRAKELAQKNIAVADLPENIITFNGNDWRIKTTRSVPSPNGEADGEYMLILLSEG